MHLKIKILYITFFLTCSLAVRAQTKDTAVINQNSFKVYKSDPGITFESSDKNYKLTLNLRAQFRVSFPYDSSPTQLNQFEDEETTDFKVRRARLKMAGNAYKPWLKYKIEYDLENSSLLDLNLSIEKLPFLSVKVGKWKADYSRERIISSGAQQTVDRSIINRPFTIDRQNGISLYGNIKGKGSANFNYWASVFMGDGRLKKSNEDSHLMYLVKTQWNPNGRVLKTTGSDVTYHQKFTSAIAIAGVTNKSAYTRFSGSGGGQLEGFNEGEPNQYRVNQYLIETAFKYKGWSWQQEYHWKEIDDKINLTLTTLRGNYIQLGYFPKYSFSFFPKNLEVFGRHTFFDPNTDISNNTHHEFTFGTNWFFHGHKNKLTLEYSHFNYNQIEPNIDKNSNRVRLQWDISF